MTQENLEEILKSIFSNHELIDIVLSAPRIKDKAGIIKVNIRPIEIKGEVYYQISDHFSQKVMHKNVSEKECQLLIKSRLVTEFKNAIIHSLNADYHIIINSKNSLSIHEKKATKSLIPLLHNRKKKLLASRRNSSSIFN